MQPLTLLQFIVETIEIDAFKYNWWSLKPWKNNLEMGDFKDRNSLNLWLAVHIIDTNFTFHAELHFGRDYIFVRQSTKRSGFFLKENYKWAYKKKRGYNERFIIITFKGRDNKGWINNNEMIDKWTQRTRTLRSRSLLIETVIEIHFILNKKRQ